jgi:hypothetical protein
MRVSIMAMLVGVTIALAGCATSSTSSSGTASSGGGSAQAHGSRGPARDSFGDPYVTDSQVRKITVGMSAGAAFRALGGKADSGYNGIQAVPPLSYDYPIRGRGNPDDVNDTKTIYWQVCVKHGRISGKVRGRMDSLPAMGC